MLWNRMIGPAQRHFRRARAERILEEFPQIVGATVIDVGGALPFWQIVGDILSPARVIIYNISSHRMAMGLQNKSGNIETHLYDGKSIPHEDNFADIVICNSVIEHVPPEGRAGLAAEIRRVGKNFAVQTPSRAFPLEMHFGLPFIHWLPRPIARKIVPISPFSLFTDANAQAYFDETRLLSLEEFQSYFPQARIAIERSAGIPKSMIAFG